MTEENVTPRVLDPKFKDAEVPASAEATTDDDTQWIVVKDDDGKDERITMDEYKKRGL